MKILRYLLGVVDVVVVVFVVVSFFVALLQYHPQTKNVQKIMQHGLMQKVSLRLPKL